jgi:hypothetical protein
VRCPDPCGKVRYDTQPVAVLGAIKVSMEDGITLVPYRAEDCKCGHLKGHSDGRLVRGRTARKIRAFQLAAG